MGPGHAGHSHKPKPQEEMMMLTLFLRKLAAGIGRAFSRPGQARDQRALNVMLMLDDHLLRDIGLTRADVIDCLSTPSDEPVVFHQMRQIHDRPVVVSAPPSDRLAA
jgi:uncharacterized protein YjiS (DUF1127 family)